MAAPRCRVLRPILRAKTPSLITESCSRFERLFIIQKRDSSSASADSAHIPLLQKLFQAPISSIKQTLDSEFTSDSTEFPWTALVSSLNTSAPQKANLIIEWKLEKLTKQDQKNHNSYALLISLCESIGNLPIALLVFSSMEAEGVRPTSSLFNALISTSLSSGNFLTALSLFEIMEGSNSYKPDSHTYNTFISAYANLGNMNATESWIEAKRASGFSVDAQIYGYLVNCCINCRDFDDAERYFEEMMLEGLIPDEFIFQNVLLMYCTQRNPGKVKDILKFILNNGMNIDQFMCKYVVDLYRELGMAEELEELLEMLTKLKKNSVLLSVAHCSVIRMYANRDRLDDVEYYVGKMLKNGISFGCEEDVERVICLYFRKETYDRLELFLESIKDSYKLTRSTYDLLGAGYRRAGLLEKLNVLMQEMKQAGFA